MLLCIAFGVWVFVSTSARILAAEARRQTEMHFVTIKAMRLREAYLRQIAELREARGETEREPARRAA